MAINQAALEKCVRTAKEAGSPVDQVQQFLHTGYIPLPWQWEFHAAARLADTKNGPVDIGLGGARGPGKSHAVLSQAGLDDCQRIPGLKGLFLRQTGIAAKESFDDLVEKVILGHTPFSRTSNVLAFPNGSRIVLGGFKDERDIDKYIGIEYDFIIVEELNQLTEEKYIKLRGSLRTSKPNWRPRMYTSFNPGGIGHKWVRDRYIIPQRTNEQLETRFIGSTYKENPHLNDEYIDYLEGLQGDLGRAWREGDWDLFAGQVFGEFRRALHAIKPVMPNPSLPHYLSFDWGYSTKSMFAAYASVVLPMKTEDGDTFNRVVTYKEWAGNQINPEGWAKKIYSPLRYQFGYCDPAMFSPGTDGSVSIAQRMMDKWKELHGDNWVQLKPGTKNRLAREATAHDWLSMAPDGLPYWLITESCPYLLETIPLLQYDENRVDDVDTNGPDHGYDSITYFLTQVRFIALKAGKLNVGKKVRTYVIMPHNKDGQEVAPSLDDIGHAYADEKSQSKKWSF